MGNIRKISISLDHKLDLDEYNQRIKNLKCIANDLSEKDQFSKDFSEGLIQLSWYEDLPVSQIVSVTVAFTSITGVDYVAELTKYYRMQEYNIVGISIGY